MATYRVVPGTFSVAPVKSSYTTDEEVELRIKYQVQRRDGLGAALQWMHAWFVYDKAGRTVAYDWTGAWTSPTTEVDTYDYDQIVRIGKVTTPGTFSGDVVIYAKG